MFVYPAESSPKSGRPPEFVSDTQQGLMKLFRFAKSDRRRPPNFGTVSASHKLGTIVGLVVVGWAVCWSVGMVDAAEPVERLAAVRQHGLQGRYEEASELYETLAGEAAITGDVAMDVPFVVGYLAVLREQGQLDTAEKVLGAALDRRPEHPRFLAEQARLDFIRGRWDAATTRCDAALKFDPDDLLARWTQACLFESTGRYKEADASYVWFVRYYNRKQPKEPEALYFTALGSLQYARWKGSTQIFDFTINTLCPDALKVEPKYWPVLVLSGNLLLEKYNRAQALPELKKALAINPRSADVLAALARSDAQERDWEDAVRHAEQALAVNPQHVEALLTLVEVKLAENELDAATSPLDRALAVNPVDHSANAYRAAWYLRKDGLPTPERLKVLLDHLDRPEKFPESPTRFEQVALDVAKRNPKPAQFLTIVAEDLLAQRRFALAEQLYKHALSVMPQLSQPKTELGMMYMQTGRIDDARKLLDEAFKGDPYHVRVSNMRKVIKVLDDYGTIATDHFVIRADTKLDRLLARYMSEYLEEVYPELTGQFGYEPPQRTQIEIYNNAKGLSAHQWFSARMVGLPWIQTIGASTGMIVAMASPSGLEQPLNWARVLKHEYVHVLTLQQTEFNIPHWYTEALAMRAEGFPRPAAWDRLLLERVPSGDLKNLDNLSQAFQRAGNKDNWDFAYCQSLLYAEYMVKRFGEASLAKLLDAYRRQLTTDQAVPEVFGVTKADFEQGYLEHLQAVVREIHASAPVEVAGTPAEIERAYTENPEDPTAGGRQAELWWKNKQREQAQQLATKVLARDSHEPHAALVLADAHDRNGEPTKAAEVLEAALDQSQPQSRVLERLAHLRQKQEQFESARKLYELGEEKYPHDTRWKKGLIALAIKTKDSKRLKPLLETLALIEYDDPAIPKKRAQLALDERDYSTQLKFARMALHIDVLDVEIHRLLAEAHLGLMQPERAVAEYETANELKPGDPALQVAWARALVQANRPADARATLNALLSKQPEYAAARELLKQLPAEKP